MHLDCLGRAVVTVVHNRTPSDDAAVHNTPLLQRPWIDERTATFTHLDVDGLALWVRDARNHLVVQAIVPPTERRRRAQLSCFRQAACPVEILSATPLSSEHGRRHRTSPGRWHRRADGRVRGTIDEPLRHRLSTRFDALHRPVERWVSSDGGPPALIEAFDYLDAASYRIAGVIDEVALTDAQRRNLLTHMVSHYDASGLATTELVDVHGRTEVSTRTLVSNPMATITDWDVSDRRALLDEETFTQVVEHDALGRTIAHFGWHREDAGQPGGSSHVAITVPSYNRRGLLNSQQLHVGAAVERGADGRRSIVPAAATRANVDAIVSTRYDARGRPERVELANGTVTTTAYDTASFRTIRVDTSRPGSTANSAIQRLRYTYDPAGNVVQCDDDAQATIWFANQQVGASSTFVHDAAGRLLEATGRENNAAVGPPSTLEPAGPLGDLPSADVTRRYTQRFRYDAVGNLEQIRHVATGDSWTNDYATIADDPAEEPGNRLWQTWVSGDRTTAVTYRWDGLGNLLNLGRTPAAQDLRWDWRGLLAGQTLGVGSTVNYQYGAGQGAHAQAHRAQRW